VRWGKVGKVERMTRAEPHPHYLHLPYREWGSGGAGEKWLTFFSSKRPDEVS
jgi:hypothetical protein